MTNEETTVMVDPFAYIKVLTARITELEAEVKRLRVILAHVPSRVAIKAKEDAGYGTAVITKGGP